MATLIITEKTSQARDLRAALGDSFGQILPAEGHLLRLAEPHEVNPGWKSWSCTLLKPEGLYPTKAAGEGNKSAKLQAIASALKRCDAVILATDCDREGQLIGQEILEHLRYSGTVRRALFTAQDPKSLIQAFRKLKPNRDLQPLYEAAVARQQADQIFNLSLTRTATRMLLAPGTRGVIGIGRVKTPTLAIVCLREIEIGDFKVEDYFEVVATATVDGGSFTLRHAPPGKARIRDRDRAAIIAGAASTFQGPLSVAVEHRRQAPPRLYDLPSLQKACGQRWGWTADKTLDVAQALYDGDGKKLITYPRAEARHLAENQIADVPAIVAAMTGLRGFAHLDIAPPVIRRGKSGVFSDAALEGVSHHAVIPNVNVMEDLERRIARLTDDEKRLFAMICRSYLAAVMPDYEYRQTSVSLVVPVPGLPGEPDGSRGGEVKNPFRAAFRAVGRIPLKPGWKAVFGAIVPEPEPSRDKGGDNRAAELEPDAEQTLPPLENGQWARLSRSRIEARKTQPPPRYNEGTLVDAMQNAWRFVTEDALRERLKEAKGIGTPATRAEIIKGLKRQGMLAAQGKLVVPTQAGLQLFGLLRAVAPTLVDPGTTAQWEQRLDDIVVGRAAFRDVIDAIASEADRVITVLRGHTGQTVDLAAQSPGVVGHSRYKRGRKARAAKDNGLVAAGSGRRTERPRRAAAKPGKAAGSKSGERRVTGDSRAMVSQTRLATAGAAPPGRPSPRAKSPPTAKMIAFAERVARDKGAELPSGYDRDFEVCRRFLDRNAGR